MRFRYNDCVVKCRYHIVDSYTSNVGFFWYDDKCSKVESVVFYDDNIITKIYTNSILEKRFL
jgi:hypothetical protein